MFQIFETIHVKHVPNKFSIDLHKLKHEKKNKHESVLSKIIQLIFYLSE